jgi:CheY-like chemotaxis protein
MIGSGMFDPDPPGPLSALLPDMTTSGRPDNRKTVLLVEDEDVLLELLRGMLEANGFNVLIAMDGLEAIRLYKERGSEIAVVLTDMGLPALGGWEVLEEILKMNPSAKVICASGFLDNSLRDEMIAAGAVEFIQKPYSYEGLIALLRKLSITDSR